MAFTEWGDLAVRLEGWFCVNQRLLPWRETYDPYHIWISEVMLQQTQVATVIPYFRRFIEKFPSIAVLAEASLDEVLSLWSGLGYYSRARNLHRAAQEIVQRFNGALPRPVEQLLTIRGIGPYTAGAIASIAYQEKVPIVDGNILRVFSRIFVLKTPLKEASSQKKIWALAETGVRNCQKARMFNQALMELGATVCIKEKPRCDLCPITSLCGAYRKGLQNELPVASKKKSKKSLFWIVRIMIHNDQILLCKNKLPWWKDLWHLPTQMFEDEAAFNQQIRALSRRRDGRWLRPFKHTVTVHSITVVPYLTSEARADLSDGVFFPLSQVPLLAISSLVKKCVAQLEYPHVD